MANKIKYGLSHVYYAVATIAANGSATYDTPVAIPGAVSMSLDPQGENTPFYADNIEYWVGNGNTGYSGDLEFALIPESFRTDVLGEIEDNKGVLVEDMNSAITHFALLFQFEGDEKNTRHVMYKCSATRPSVSGQTTDEEIEPQTETLTITAASVHNDDLDLDVVKARCNEDDAPYATWFNAVYQSSGVSA